MRQDTTLGEVVRAGSGSIKTGPFGTSLAAHEYSENGVPLISVGEIDYGRLRLRNGTPRVDQDVLARLPEYILRAGDVVFGRKGAVDRCAPVRPREEGWFLGSDGIRVRFGSNVCAEFMAYALSALHAREWLLRHAGGSTLKSLNQSTLESLPLRIPPLGEQRAIAEVLSALDDKIAANDLVIRTLQLLEDAQYVKSLEYGSTPRTVQDVANFKNRQRIPLSARERVERPGTVPYFGAAGQLDTVNTPLFNEQIVLVGEDGTVQTEAGRAVVQYVWGPSWVNNHAHVLVGNGIATELLRVVLRHLMVADAVTGAVQPKLSMGRLAVLIIDLPQGAALAAIERHAIASAAAFRSAVDESCRLAALRDALLPELMSGRLHVKDAESRVEELL